MFLQFLNLIRMGLFEAAHGTGWAKKLKEDSKNIKITRGTP